MRTAASQADTSPLSNRQSQPKPTRTWECSEFTELWQTITTIRYRQSRTASTGTAFQPGTRKKRRPSLKPLEPNSDLSTLHLLLFSHSIWSFTRVQKPRSSRRYFFLLAQHCFRVCFFLSSLDLMSYGPFRSRRSSRPHRHPQ